MSLKRGSVRDLSNWNHMCTHSSSWFRCTLYIYVRLWCCEKQSEESVKNAMNWLKL